MITIYLIISGAFWGLGCILHIRDGEAAAAVLAFALFALALYCLTLAWGTGT